MTKQTFLRGTLILIIAGLITKILGFVNRIVVARIMGAEGVGLYMMAVPTLATCYYSHTTWFTCGHLQISSRS